jgi:membrane protease subunit (stomatin/prohibitin family)
MNQIRRELAQEFDRLPWGTLMPVQVRLGSEIVSIRARGTCSVAISDPQLFEERVSDVESLRTQVCNIITLRMAETLAETSAGKSTLTEIEATLGDIQVILQSKVEQAVGSLGLTVKQLSIQAIEKR